MLPTLPAQERDKPIDKRTKPHGIKCVHLWCEVAVLDGDDPNRITGTFSKNHHVEAGGFIFKTLFESAATCEHLFTPSEFRHPFLIC
jgi:hypothetical protein